MTSIFELDQSTKRLSYYRFNYHFSTLWKKSSAIGRPADVLSQNMQILCYTSLTGFYVQIKN